MGLVRIATESNAEVEKPLFKGNDYTLIVNVNGTAPAGSELVITVKAEGSDVFETLEENGTIDLTAPKSVKIAYACGPAYLEAIKLTPNATFTADPTSTYDAKVNTLLTWSPV